MHSVVTPAPSSANDERTHLEDFAMNQLDDDPVDHHDEHDNPIENDEHDLQCDGSETSNTDDRGSISSLLSDGNSFSEDDDDAAAYEEIEEWHGRRVKADGEVWYHTKFANSGLKWIPNSWFQKSSITRKDALRRHKLFPPCQKCSTRTRHICWDISQYDDCEGVYGRRVLNKKVQIQVRWMEDNAFEWIYAGQFSSPAWDDVQAWLKKNRPNKKDTWEDEPPGTILTLTAGRQYIPTVRKCVRQRCSNKTQGPRRKSSSKGQPKTHRVPRQPDRVLPLCPTLGPPVTTTFRIGGLAVERIIFKRADCAENQPGYRVQVSHAKTLAEAYFRGRIRTTVMSEKVAFPANWKVNGEVWNLLCVKENKRQQSGRFGGDQVEYECVFVATQLYPEDDNPLDLQAALERLGNFRALRLEKVAARLSLFFTPAGARWSNHPFMLYTLSHAERDRIQLLPEDGHEGCGFFRAELFRAFSKDHLQESRWNKDTVALQVRIVSPQHGFFKGVLMRRPATASSTDKQPPLLELPESMRKVPPSLRPEPDLNTAILIRSRFPSSSNVLRSRLWANKEDLPRDKRKKLSKMIEGLFLQLRMPSAVVNEFAKDHMRQKYMKSAMVAGVSDPTGALDFGCVYFTGWHTVPVFNEALKSRVVFISRYPMGEPSDARLVHFVTEKPSDMTQEAWDYLQGLPFGLLIFGHRSGFEPMPMQIAEGDLDGDLYFVGWDARLLKLKCFPLELKQQPPEVDKLANSSVDWSHNSNWLVNSYSCMGDLTWKKQLSHLIGKLHSGLIGTKTSMEDRAHFGRAYKASLTVEKHSSRIDLPYRLWDAVPTTLHHFLGRGKAMDCKQITSETEKHTLQA